MPHTVNFSCLSFLYLLEYISFLTVEKRQKLHNQHKYAVCGVLVFEKNVVIFLFFCLSTDFFHVSL